MNFSFTVFCHPQPQGSSRAFVRNGRASITSDNAKLKPFRHAVTQVAIVELAKRGLRYPLAAKHEPVRLSLAFNFLRPESAPKKRTENVVKPDLDKLVRSTLDSLTGVLYVDDAQVIEVKAVKRYAPVEGVEIGVEG